MTAVPILVELARRDVRLYGLRQQITNLPRRIQDLMAQRAKLELQLREAEGRLQQSESARRKLEGELTEYRQRKAKSESRLATLTSTEQYQALVKEIGCDESSMELDGITQVAIHAVVGRRTAEQADRD